MKSLDLTLPTPSENLACDEALLELCESGGGGELLRFWEPPEYFVVVGYANRVAAEVNRAVCESHHVPIYRRCSGGGTVVQGPGCLNYSLVLGIGDSNPLSSITAANRFIMKRNRKAIETILKSKLEISGHTDLVIDGRKFSGNSQRRKKRFLLFHGTFLLGFDLQFISTLLPRPSREPDYRKGRSHEEFLVNLRVPASVVKDALREQWNAGEPFEDAPRETIARLARDKYETPEWNFKF